MIQLFLIISFFLEIVFYNLFSYQYITFLFFFISLILIYPKLISDRYKYCLILSICGFIYDICITSIISIDAILFPIMGLINIFYHKNFNNHFFNNIIFINAIIIIYRLLFNFFFIIIDMSTFNFFYNLHIILVFNSIYYIICYILLKKR